MANLTDTLVNGALRVTGKIYGSVTSADTATSAGSCTGNAATATNAQGSEFYARNNSTTASGMIDAASAGKMLTMACSNTDAALCVRDFNAWTNFNNIITYDFSKNTSKFYGNAASSTIPQKGYASFGNKTGGKTWYALLATITCGKQSNNDISCVFGYSVTNASAVPPVHGTLKMDVRFNGDGSLSTAKLTQHANEQNETAKFMITADTDANYNSTIKVYAQIYISAAQVFVGYSLWLLSEGGWGSAPTGLAITFAQGETPFETAPTGSKTAESGNIVHQLNVTRGSSIGISTTGYWAAMCNSSTSGDLPTASKWWHVLSMDSDSNDWFSQLAIATQDGNGVWWRKNNSAGTAIASSTWHRLAEADSNGQAASSAAVVQTSTTSGSYPLLSSASSSPTSGSAYGTRYNSSVFLTPGEGMITATAIRVKDTNYGTMQYNNTDHCIEFVF